MGISLDNPQCVYDFCPFRIFLAINVSVVKFMKHVLLAIVLLRHLEYLLSKYGQVKIYHRTKRRTYAEVMG